MIGKIHTIYDPEAELWTTGTSIPNSKYGGSGSTVFDDKIYFFNPNQTQIYHPTNDTWSFGTPLPSYFASASCCAITGNMAPNRIYVFGGWVSALETSDTTLIYEPETDTWKFGASMISGRVGPACAVVDDKIYMIGGFAHAFLISSANHQYTPIEYIPEFSSLIVLPLSGAVMLVVIIYRKASTKKLQN